MLNQKETEQRVNQINHVLGKTLDDLIDEYGIESIINVLASICFRRGKAMINVPEPNNRAITLSRKYMKNGKKLIELESFHKQIEIAPNPYALEDDSVSDAKLREKIREEFRE